MSTIRRSLVKTPATPGLSQPNSASRTMPFPSGSQYSSAISSMNARSAQYDYRPSSNVLHMQDCDDPDCAELEQLKALQKSLDHFTDYDYYESCCDGHLHGKRGAKDCCIGNDANESCPECCDECIECKDKHKDCYEEVAVCDDDCEECEEECEEQGHEPEHCPRDHPTTRDNCTLTCDIEPLSLPQLGPTDVFDTHGIPDLMQSVTPCTDECAIPLPAALAEPVSQPSLTPLFDSDMDHWQTFVQTHHCATDPCMVGQPPSSQIPQHIDPAFGFTFGCDPTIPGNQYPWQKSVPHCNLPTNLPTQHLSETTEPMLSSFTSSAISKLSTSQPPLTSATSIASKSTSDAAVVPSRVCEWLMPCGSICGASFSRTEDLKRHIKNSHTTKGTVACNWNSCTASFASEAALTGHISKKHLTVSDEEGPWKCTFPGCTKSFMYKQVRDDHVASHNGGNRMHCPICHQWLNCEGSNFRRHMASHGPKNEYMRCRYENMGCKKRFPRLDNLRRHEACCKFGKKAAGVHHHHHRVHIGHAE